MIRGLSKDEIRKEWVGAVNDLVNQVVLWASQEAGWEAVLSEKEITEEALGTYSVPVVTIDIADSKKTYPNSRFFTPDGRLVSAGGVLILEPIARNWLEKRCNSKGIVE